MVRVIKMEILKKCVATWKASSWMPDVFDVHGHMMDLFIYGHTVERVYLDESGEMKYQRVDIFK